VSSLQARLGSSRRPLRRWNAAQHVTSQCIPREWPIMPFGRGEVWQDGRTSGLIAAIAEATAANGHAAIPGPKTKANSDHFRLLAAGGRDRGIADPSCVDWRPPTPRIDGNRGIFANNVMRHERPARELSFR
jgi:hypothetical protein